MKLGHLILKVPQLDQAIQEQRKKGFTVEYGRAKNPRNALIYFPEGPYIELLSGSGMPGAAKTLLLLFGKRAFVERFSRLDICEPGYQELVLETCETSLHKERVLLRNQRIKSCEAPMRRTDIRGTNLRFRIASPTALDIPLLMTRFSTDPRPMNLVHPNGIRRINHVIYGANPTHFPLIKQLCDDENLELTEGSDIKVEFV